MWHVIKTRLGDSWLSIPLRRNDRLTPPPLQHICHPDQQTQAPASPLLTSREIEDDKLHQQALLARYTRLPERVPGPLDRLSGRKPTHHRVSVSTTNPAPGERYPLHDRRHSLSPAHPLHALPSAPQTLHARQGIRRLRAQECSPGADLDGPHVGGPTP